MMIFNGKEFAREIEERVRIDVAKMTRKPKIVSILVGSDPSSVLYTKLKMAAAKRVGIEFEVERMVNDRWTMDNLTRIIKEIGERKDVTGVMVQLPLPEYFKGETLKVLGAIPLKKDVDGLRWEESKIMPATVRAVLAILDKIAESQISNSQILKSGKCVVVGARGIIGRPLTHYLRERGCQVSEVEWDTPDAADLIRAGEVVISCVGKEGVVTGEMVAKGAIVVDVGSPKPDMTAEVYQKASVVVPSPGGVGPVTIACLLENAVSML
ncbi:MAG: bifunctional 5,10-methylenetetrahydrofolate dehydrogenase/5,10-methenyltetrahydrofolate cyclohydrolase [bacterium]